MGNGYEKRPRRGVTRRGLLASAGAGAAGVGLGAAGAELSAARNTSKPAPIPFYGAHQAGIATPPQEHLALAAFDFRAESSSELRELLMLWTRAAARLTEGLPLSQDAAARGAPVDPGEAHDLDASALTVTVGLGASLFEFDGRDRLGLRARRPTALADLPPFRGDALEERYSGGDLCVQACADDAQVAFHAVHALARAAHGVAGLRWLLHGFRPNRANGPEGTRNLMGFRDGQRNLAPRSVEAMRRHVWVGGGDRPWLQRGTYLVVRRIRMLLDEWDELPLRDQERTIGRSKGTGAALGRRDQAALPADAHIRLAGPESNGGVRMLRRGYSYSDGVDPDTGQLDAGLVFLAFQRDPTKQFVPVQRRLAYEDALSRHIVHTGSALFACLPGARRGGYLGEGLFALA